MSMVPASTNSEWLVHLKILQPGDVAEAGDLCLIELQPSQFEGLQAGERANQGQQAQQRVVQTSDQWRALRVSRLLDGVQACPEGENSVRFMPSIGLGHHKINSFWRSSTMTQCMSISHSSARIDEQNKHLRGGRGFSRWGRGAVGKGGGKGGEQHLGVVAGGFQVQPQQRGRLGGQVLKQVLHSM